MLGVTFRSVGIRKEKRRSNSAPAVQHLSILGGPGAPRKENPVYLAAQNRDDKVKAEIWCVDSRRGWG